MSEHLSGAGLGAALAVTAAAGSLAVGLSLHRGGVLVLLLSVLVATRWYGRVAGYAATLACAGLALVMLPIASAQSRADRRRRRRAGAARPARRRHRRLDGTSPAPARRASRRHRPREGGVPRHRLARAADAAQRDPGLDRAAAHAARRRAAAGRSRARGHRAQRPAPAGARRRAPDRRRAGDVAGRVARLELRGMLQDLLADLEPGATAAGVGLARRRSDLFRRVAGGGRPRVGARRCEPACGWRCATSSTTPSSTRLPAATCARVSVSPASRCSSSCPTRAAASRRRRSSTSSSRSVSWTTPPRAGTAGLGLGLTIARKLIERARRARRSAQRRRDRRLDGARHASRPLRFVRDSP